VVDLALNAQGFPASSRWLARKFAGCSSSRELRKVRGSQIFFPGNVNRVNKPRFLPAPRASRTDADLPNPPPEGNWWIRVSGGTAWSMQFRARKGSRAACGGSCFCGASESDAFHALILNASDGPMGESR